MNITVVPKCPVCGSQKTGYYIIGYDNGALKEKYFHRGERIRFTPFPSVNNCYCCDCGMKWKGTLKKKHLSKEEFSSYLQDHDFISDRDKILNERKIKKDFSEELKYKKQKRIKIIQFLTLIFFGIDLKKHKSVRK